MYGLVRPNPKLIDAYDADFGVKFSNKKNLYYLIDLPAISCRVKVVGAQLKRGGCLALAQYGQPKFLTQEEEGHCSSEM